MKYFGRFFAEFQQDLKAFVFWCVLFTVFRAVFIFCYSGQIAETGWSDILTALWLGLRLSLKTAGIIMLLGVVCATLPRVVAGRWPAEKIRNVVHYLAIVFFTICFFARIPYYKIFNSAFNMMLINGAHDDIAAIINTAVNEYQLLWRLPAALIIAACICLVFKWWLQNSYKLYFDKLSYKPLVAGLTIVFLPTMWVFVRYGGAFSYDKSINWESAARLKSNLLNEAILDDGQALYRVYSMKRELDKVTNVNIPLHELQGKITALGGDGSADSISKAFVRTVQQPKLNQQPDNVVVIIGESFGLWPFLPEFQKLGLVNESLILQESANGTAVRYMLPNGSGTISAVNGIVTGLPDTGLYENYQPNSMQDKYQSGIGYIMKQLGYKTVFWYGGFSGWQNIKNFVLAQSFDEFHCADEFTYSGGNAWGCPDKVLFENINRYISDQKAGEKVLHVVLTSTNHPPYTIDVAAEGFDKEKIKTLLYDNISKDENTVNELGHIWYADQAVGTFVKNTRKIKPESLFVITGDHSERFNFAKDQELKTLSAVPCIFYGQGIQKQWLENAYGCHIQIAGTVAELIAPAGFEYTALLPDLFAEQSVFNHRLYADKNGMGLLSDRKDISSQADYARSIASWRILKGDNY